MSEEVRHTYEYDVDLDSDVAPARVIRLVKPGSRVLEIGAGPGSITRHLSGTLNCSVVALEIDPTAIAKLKAFASSVYSLDLNDEQWSATIQDQEGLFDYVIAADVLEHVYDPWTVLKGMKSLLNPSGAIILSLPHAGHASVVGCLMDEDVDYQRWGLLDKTHIRFFGMKNIEKLYASQGLAIQSAEFVVRTPEMTEFVRRWKRLPRDIRDALQRNRYSHVYQVVSLAVPRERATRTLDLLDMTVPAPDAKTIAHWTNTMASLRLESDSDTRSTIDRPTPSGVNEPAPARQAIVRDSNPAQGVKPTTPDTRAVVTPETMLVQDNKNKPLLVAYYLTQFHPIPENDEWWGKGFTEWTNVTKAHPRYFGHYQPHLPTELGFYDLRVRETRREQIKLAKQYGVGGFCYYYYWFAGHKLLEKPLEDMLADPASDMPFCLMWANENWTRTWDGGSNQILMAQRFDPEDDVNFIKSLIPYISDSRYIKVNGAPLILVYAPKQLPTPVQTIQTWRDYCRASGIGDIHVACALTHGIRDHRPFGFDSSVEFPPHLHVTKDFSNQLFLLKREQIAVRDIVDLAEAYLRHSYTRDKPGYRAVCPSWDNSPRRAEKPSIYVNGTPQNYEWWLAQAIAKTQQEFPDESRIVFINAWNEWAEGAHLEPDRKYGRAFLEATLKALQGTKLTGWTHRGLSEELVLPPNPTRYFRFSSQAPASPANTSAPQGPPLA